MLRSPRNLLCTLALLIRISAQDSRPATNDQAARASDELRRVSEDPARTPGERAHAFWLLGLAQHSLQELAAAQQSLERSLGLLAEERDLDRMVVVCRDLADCHWDRGDKAGTIQAGERGLALLARIGTPSTEVHTAGSDLAVRVSQACSEHERGVAMARKAQELARLGRARDRMLTATLEECRWLEARDDLRAALDQRNAAADQIQRLAGIEPTPELDAQFVRNRVAQSHLLRQLGRNEDGLRFAQEAVQRCQALVDPPVSMVASARSALGLAWSEAGEPATALGELTVALHLAQGPERAEILANLAFCDAALGASARGAERARQAIQLLVGAGITDRRLAAAHAALGMALFAARRREQLGKALAAFQEARRLLEAAAPGARLTALRYRASAATCRQLRGEYRLALDEHEAILAAARALPEAERLGLEAVAHHNAANCCRQLGDDGAARAHWEAALAIHRVNPRPIGYRVTAGLGTLCLDAGESDAAERLLRESIAEMTARRGSADVLDELDRAAHFREMKSCLGFDGMVRLLAGDPRRSPELLDTVEKALGRSLRDLLERGRRAWPQPADGAAFRMPVAVPASSDEVRRMLRPGELLLSYYLADQGGYLALVPPRGERDITVHRLTWPDGSPVTRESATIRVQAWRNATQSEALPGAPAADNTAGHALWAALVPEPVRKAVLAARLVYIVPHGALHFVPFQALPMAMVPSARVWADTGVPVVYGASAAVLLACRQRGQQQLVFGRDVLTVGAPDAGPPIEQSGHEAVGIVAQYRRGLALTGKDATLAGLRTSLLAERTRIVHLATHADRDANGSPRLLLAPAAKGDTVGELHLAELLRGQWNSAFGATQLVILSGCDTHTGMALDDDGPVGLTWGMLAAGAHSVVASLWSVDDASTRALMVEFHSRLAQPQGRSTAVCLAEAMQAVRQRKQWERPWFWAGFVLVGDPE